MIVKWQQEQLLKWVSPVYQNKVCYTMKPFSGFPSSVLLACTFFLFSSYFALFSCTTFLNEIPAKLHWQWKLLEVKKDFFDTCGFILSYFKFGDFIILMWKIQYISNDTQSKGWLTFFLSKQMELLEVLKSHQVMLNVERTAVKRYILLQVISEI